MKSRLLLLSLALAVAILAIAGCGKESGRTLAKVGDHEITQEEFNESFPAWLFNFASAEEEFAARRGHLDSIIITWMLVEAAYEKNIDQLEELARVVMANEEKFLLDALYQQEVLSYISVTETELRDYYNHLEFKVRAAHILVNELDTANMVMQKLGEGESFDKLAFDYSVDPSSKRNKGDLGYFVWGSMVDEFQEAAFKLEPGEVSTPVKSMFGYHIIKVIDKLPNNKRADFESEKERLNEIITRRKQMQLGQQYITDLKEKYPVTIDTRTCEYLLKKREALYPPMVLENIPRNDVDPEALDRDERELVLASWDGGQLTVWEYLSLAKESPLEQRPSFDAYDSLANFIFTIKSKDMLVLEAHRLGIDTGPEYIAKIKLFKELNMADFMRNDSIPKPDPPSDDVVRVYYDEHIDEFTVPAKIRVFEILLSDELQARKLQKEIRSLAKFKEVAMDLTERPGKRSAKGDLDYIEEAWFPEIFAVAKETGIGEIGGPVASFGKYSIFYVIDKIDPQIKDYLGVKRGIVEQLIAQQNAIAVQQWVDERRLASKVDVFEDAIWAEIDRDAYAAAPATGQ